MLKLKKKSISNTEKENKYGKTVPNITEIGEMVWPKAKGRSIMPMVTYILVNSFKIELMALAYMFIPMARGTRASGKMTCKMAQVKKSSRTVQSMMAYSKMARNGVKELTSGQTSLFTSVTGLTTI